MTMHRLWLAMMKAAEPASFWFDSTPCACVQSSNNFIYIGFIISQTIR